MADSDAALYTLRYNQVSQAIEGQGGTPSWNTLTLTNPDAAAGITQLTGQVTAGPGSGSVVATLLNSAVTGQALTGYVSGAGTVAATDTILQAVNKLNGNTALKFDAAGGPLTGALSITGTALAGSTTSQSGVMAYLGFNGSGNRQMLIKDGTVANNSSNRAIRIAFAPNPFIDSISTDLSTTFILQLGAAEKGVQITGPLIIPTGTLAGTGTVTPVATTNMNYSIPVSGAVTLNGPTGGYDGQKATFRVVNDASHSVTLATGSGNFRFGTDITGYTNSVSTTDYIGAIYNTAAVRWDVVSVVQGF